jgi:hypothetical protein
VTERVICPHCHEEVEAGWLCSKCGQPLSTTSLLVDDPAQTESTMETEPRPTEAEQHAFESPMDAIADEPESEPSAQPEPEQSPPEDEMESQLEASSPVETPAPHEPLVEDRPEPESEEPVFAAAEAVEAEEEPTGEETLEEPEPQSAPPPLPGAATTRGGLDLPSFSEVIARVRLFFTFSGNTPDIYWRIIAIGVGLVLLAMLAGSAGLAILIGIFIVPVVILRYLSAVDLFEREPWWGIGSSAGAGLFGGLVIGGIGHYITDSLWIENAPLRVGAAGFAGEAADHAGRAPLSVLFLCGLLLPAIAEAAKLAAPIFLRQWPFFRNEVMDGITLAAAAGGGFAAGTAIVHFWPVIVRGDSVNIGLSEWTGMLLGIAIVRPIIQVATSALLGAAVWRYYMTQSTAGLILPVVAGAGGAVFYGLSDIIVEPAGTTVELIWSALIGAVLLYVLRVVIRQARLWDATALGMTGQRTICPVCRRVTPVGTFCANCGAPLADAVTSATRAALEGGSEPGA